MVDRSLVPVFSAQQHVGDVAIGAHGELSFSYASDWLNHTARFSLSASIPLRDAGFAHEVIEPWLANLIPEEQQLTGLTRLLGLDRTDILGVLMAIGGDTAGALSFGAPGNPAHWNYVPLTDFYGEPDAETALARHLDDLETRPFLADEEGIRQSLAGGQGKSILAVLDKAGQPQLRLPGPGDQLALPLNGAPSTLILKPDNARLPGMPENEAYCLHLARQCGLNAAGVAVLAVQDRKALVILRYDRQISAGHGIVRCHQEDFVQASGKRPAQKYERTPGGGLSAMDIFAAARGLPAKDRLALIDQYIFNILAGNTDAHAKNYSMLMTPEAGLAPLYDVSTVLTWPHINQYHAQDIAGRKRKPSDIAGRHWQQIALDSGYNAREFKHRAAELIALLVKSREAAIDAVCRHGNANPDIVRSFAEIIEKNALRIEGRLLA